nr:hypothetical protein [Neorhizobium tomejilense]
MIAKNTEFPDIESVVHWFMHDKDDLPKDPPSHDEADLRELVQVMLTRPHPFGFRDDEPVDPADAWNWILEFGFLYLHGTMGWITREGKFLTCGWAKHDNLLYWLNMEPEDAERQGWVRVTQGKRYRSAYRLSPNQRRVLKKLDIEPDKEAERMLPLWVAYDTRPISAENAGADRNG